MTFNTPVTNSGSSADVGSSNNNSGVSRANALAIPTRCCCPPDNVAGYLCLNSDNPTCSR